MSCIAPGPIYILYKLKVTFLASKICENFIYREIFKLDSIVEGKQDIQPNEFPPDGMFLALVNLNEQFDERYILETGSGASVINNKLFDSVWQTNF